MEIREATTREDIGFCEKAILEFRPNLNPNTFIDEILQMMRAGFRLLYIPDDDGTAAAAIAGLRVFTMLRTGTIIYIDDLFTFEANRGKGYASALLGQINEIARANHIKTVHLDSGFNLHPAHRLYLSQGYILGAHHFVKYI